MDAVADEEGQAGGGHGRNLEPLDEQPQQGEAEDKNSDADDRIAAEKHGRAPAQQTLAKRQS